MARVFRFDADLGQRVTRFGSDFVISRLFHPNAAVGLTAPLPDPPP